MKRMNKRGTLTLYVMYFITVITIITIAAFLAPMGVRFNSEMYAAGESIMLDANETISQISDATVRGQIQDTISNAMGASQDNIDINANIFRYSWIPIVGLTALIVFMAARSLTETNRPGGGGFV